MCYGFCRQPWGGGLNPPHPLPCMLQGGLTSPPPPPAVYMWGRWRGVPLHPARIPTHCPKCGMGARECGTPTNKWIRKKSGVARHAQVVPLLVPPIAFLPIADAFLLAMRYPFSLAWLALHRLAAPRLVVQPLATLTLRAVHRWHLHDVGAKRDVHGR